MRNICLSSSRVPPKLYRDYITIWNPIRLDYVTITFDVVKEMEARRNLLINRGPLYLDTTDDST